MSVEDFSSKNVSQTLWDRLNAMPMEELKQQLKDESRLTEIFQAIVNDSSPNDIRDQVIGHLKEHVATEINDSTKIERFQKILETVGLNTQNEKIAIPYQEQLCSFLLEAIKHGNQDLALMLTEKLKPNAKEANAIVDSAVENNNLPLLQALVKKGIIDLKKREANHRTRAFRALFKAQENKEITSFLLDYCRRSDFNDKEMSSFRFEFFCKLGLAQKVIAKGLKPTDVDKKGYSALHLACQYGDRELVKFLLEEQKFDPNIVLNENTVSPLTAACMREKESPEIVKLLLEKGAQVSTPNSESSPLECAYNHKQHDVIELLYDAIKDPNIIVDKNGTTPFKIACSHFENARRIKSMLLQGADPFQVDYKNNMPYGVSSLTNRQRILLFLKENQREIPESAIIPAVRCGSLELLQLIAEQSKEHFNANINDGSCTALQTACFIRRKEDIVAFLLEHGANVNDRVTEDDFTPLQFACSIGSEKIVKMLIDAGADVNAKKRDISALDVAIIANESPETKLKLINLLIQNQANFSRALLTAFGRYEATEDPLYVNISRLFFQQVKHPSIGLDDKGNTPMSYAFKLGDAKTIIGWIKKGFSPSFDSLAVQTALIELIKSHPEKANKLISALLQQKNIDFSPLIKPVPPLPSLLHAACINGNLELVEMALQMGFKVNTLFDNHSLLASAVAGDNISFELIKFIAQKIAKSDGIDKDAHAFDMAITKYFETQDGKYLEAMKLLFQYVKDPTIPDAKGISPMLYAFQIADLKTIKAWIAQGFQLPLEHHYIKTQINSFIQNNPADAIELLRLFIDKKLDLSVWNKAYNEDGLTPLHLASALEDIDIISLLLQGGMDIEVLDQEERQTPLGVAAKAGSIDTVDFLLDQGAQINPSPFSNNSSLQCAIEGQHSAMVEHLIQKGADVNYKNKLQKTPFYYACAFGSLELLQLLIDKGAKINIGEKDNEGLTSLHAACTHDDLKLIQFLLDLDFDINSETDSKVTPLTFSSANNFSAAQFLLERGAKITFENLKGNPLWNAKDDDVKKLILYNIENPKAIYNSKGQTVFHLACELNDPDLVQKLIAQGANVNTQDRQGNTPLHLLLSFQSDNLAVLEKLLDNGVDPFIQNKKGETPYLLAQKKYNLPLEIILQLLRCSLAPAKFMDLSASKDSLTMGLYLNPLKLCLMNASPENAKEYAIIAGKENTRKHLQEIAKEYPKTATEFQINCGCDINPKHLEASEREISDEVATLLTLFDQANIEESSRQELRESLKLFVKNVTDPYPADLPPKLSDPATEEELAALENYEQAIEGHEIIYEEIEALVRKTIEKISEPKFDPAFRTKILIQLATLGGQDEAIYLDEVRKINNFVNGLPADAPIKIWNYRDLLPLFDEINFIDPSKPGYRDPNTLKDELISITPEQLRDNIAKKMIPRMKRNIVFLLTPPKEDRVALTQFYREVKAQDRKVLEKITAPDCSLDMKASMLIDLAISGGHCGTRYLDEPQSINTMLSGKPKGLKEQLSAMYHKMRLGVVESLVESIALDDEKFEEHTPHLFNFIIRTIGKEIGVEAFHYADIYSPQNITEEELLTAFNSQYNSYTMLERLRTELNAKKPEFSTELLVQWFIDNTPEDWNAEFYGPIETDLTTLQAKNADAKEIKKFLASHAIVYQPITPQQAVERALDTHLAECQELFELVQERIEEKAEQAEILELLSEKGITPQPGETYQQAIEGKKQKYRKKFGTIQAKVLRMQKKNASPIKIRNFLNGENILLGPYTPELAISEDRGHKYMEEVVYNITEKDGKQVYSFSDLALIEFLEKQGCLQRNKYFDIFVA